MNFSSYDCTINKHIKSFFIFATQINKKIIKIEKKGIGIKLSYYDIRSLYCNIEKYIMTNAKTFNETRCIQKTIRYIIKRLISAVISRLSICKGRMEMNEGNQR